MRAPGPFSAELDSACRPLTSQLHDEEPENPSAFVATAAVIGLLALIVEMDALHGFFTTTDLTSGQWLTCLAIGSAILWTGEIVKIVLRAGARRTRAAMASGR